ncbi:hypothetical protein EHS25_008609 [Saitozyma podzolica]|uniref:Uncharacterized protein n=1 Tax=Saitozyma podzolica TaxID=1890683 RepID=A0A427YM55_9TREE|nr:hypothetical protein EHS25_008609 [Saitozyma podzolica]
MLRPPRLLVPFLALRHVLATTSTPNTGDQPQAFLFGFTTSSLILPVTASCPTPLTLSQLTTTNNPNAPDPSAPYTMVMLVHEQLEDGAGARYERMYSASMNVGDMSAVKSINHPWMNGTQFIACMWSANGVSGGCQDLFTVVPSELTADAYATSSSTCRASNVSGSWVTPPRDTLNVQVEGQYGNLATNGWPAACSDIRVTPKNGTAPFTLLVAPAFHPPVNITTPSLSSMNYTIRLTHGQAFMIGVYDSAGNSFAFGPLHAGDSNNLGCLQVATGQTMPDVGSKITLSELVGSVTGSFVLGAIGATIAILFLRRKPRPRLGKLHSSDSQQLLESYANPRPSSQRAESTTSTIPKPDFSPDPVTLNSLEARSSLYDPYLPDGPVYASPPVETAIPFPSPPAPVVTNTYSSPFDTPALATHDRPMDFGPPLAERERREASDSTNSRESMNRRSSGSGALSRRSAQRDSFNGKRSSGLHLVGAPSSPTESWRESPFVNETEDAPSGSGGFIRRGRKIYVVHSDAQDGDVHIQLPDGGGRVIELPPTYRDDPHLSASSLTLPHQRTGSAGSGG